MATPRRTTARRRGPSSDLARWEENRDRLMALAAPGRRPPEWWEHEAPSSRPHRRFGALAEAVVLADLGELRPDELAYLRRLAEGDGAMADDAAHALDVAENGAEPVLTDRGLR